MNSIRQDQGRMIHIDGIDGSGKSTLLNAALAWATAQGFSTFDVVEWSKREHRLPTLEDIGDVDVLFTAEPTHAGIGDVIRNEIIRDGSPYDARFTAQAFALDRGVQYRRLILPFLQSRPGRWVIQDRGLSTSLAYQPLQSERDTADPVQHVTLDWLLTHDGNQIAYNAPPDVFVLVDIDPSVALARLANRTEKFDNHLYEKEDFQIALAERYKRPDFHTKLTSQGTEFVIIDGGRTKEEVAEDMRNVLSQLAHKPE